MSRRKTPTDGIPFLCICGIVAAVMVILVSVLHPVTVSGTSMYPSLNSGDILTTTAVPKQQLAYGDIVVFEDPTGSGKKLIKRIIGLPGDSLAFTQDTIIINDGERTVNVSSVGKYSGTVMVLGADEFFMVGDNYLNSRDSRSFGPVAYSLIDGKAESLI